MRIICPPPGIGDLQFSEVPRARRLQPRLQLVITSVLAVMVPPRKLVVAAIILTVQWFTYASSAKDLTSGIRGNTPGFIVDSISSNSSSNGSSSGLTAGIVLSSPTGGQISFRTKTRNGVRGVACSMRQESAYPAIS